MTEHVTTPLSPEEVSTILFDLKGFGIADNEEIITLNVRGRRVQLRVSNISNDDEVFGMMRTEGVKGFAWVQRMRCEILARAITWINGVETSTVEYAVDPYSGEERPLKLILVDMLMKWGQEAVLIFWKIYMLHCQNLENSILEQLPDAMVMTQVEQRFLARVGEELAAVGALAIAETAEEIGLALDPDEKE
jgi:hypothetical protein